MAHLPSHYDEPERRWEKARETFYESRYHLKGFESLHALSLHYYEHELAKFEEEVQLDGGLRPADEEKQLKRLRMLLHEYSSAITALERTLARAAILPSPHPHPTGPLSGALAGPSPELTRAQPHRHHHHHHHHTLERHKYDLSPSLLAEPLRFLLEALTPLRLQSSLLRPAAAAARRDFEAGSSPHLSAEIWASSPRFAAAAAAEHADPDAARTLAVETLRRFATAVVGGAMLLVPMIMSFRDTAAARLVVVSVAILVFGLVLSVGVRVSFGQLLAITAAYASVMVVYLGSTTEGDTDGGGRGLGR